MKIILSPLNHTWILDLDGSFVKHNGYKIDGRDSWLVGAKDFLKNIPETDLIIFITSRTIEYKNITEEFLSEEGINYAHIIYEAPFGERILINDSKPSGLKTALAITVQRDWDVDFDIEFNNDL